MAAKFLNGSTRQLNNLATRPSVAIINGQPAADARPHFDLGLLPEQDPTYGEEPPYRVLRWHPVSGDEVCATSVEDLAAYEARGYVSYPPNSKAVSPLESIKAELADLTPEERQLVEDAQRKSRMDTIQKKLAALSADDLDRALTGAAEQVAKRGPGRPRKIAG